MKVIKMKHVYVLAMVVVLVGTTVAADSATNTCSHTCGGQEIPYPFGIDDNNTSSECFLGRRLIPLTCNESKIYAGDMEVLNIDIFNAQIEASFYVSKYCGVHNYNKPRLNSGSYIISSKENKFITVGINSFGYFNSYRGGENKYSTGCLTRSFGLPRLIDNETCSGIGCCQVDIPPKMWNISIEAYNFNQNSSLYCSYAFVVKNGSYTFSTNHLSPKGFRYEELPVVLDWTIGEENCSTASSKKNGVNYGCKNNSHCDDKDTYFGYRCHCNQGFEGNPYHPNGCTDINECEKDLLHDCKTKAYCNNTDGKYNCFCPKGYSGNGTKEVGCQLDDENANSIVLLIVLGVGITFILLFLGTFSYLMYHKRKFIKMKEKFFEQNGGLILKQKLSTREDSSSQTRQDSSTQSAKIFTQDQLNKATKNFDENLIIGKGGFGTVFKGLLDDKRIVAIKKSKIIDRSQIDQFINEVVVLSQINHRNVVKLLGCCLETEVPLLVYEFVTNGTLSGFIHTQSNKVNNETWKTRLKIAAEVAEALSYLHSYASIPIIHRDVKSDNILLDRTNTAKVSDFGASRLVPLDQTEIATMVQGTIGYLDPEYMQTSQLTEKSDVYSFGVVLVELLTGEKPFCFVIQDGLWNEENKQEIKEVAVLAAKCLRLRGEERPSMKEVAMELEGMRLMNKHSWINDDSNVEESRFLLHESSSSFYEPGDSITHGDIGYDSLKDHVLIALDDGR
ncbi:wall-associated receptor kinase-like protein [Medicago truncatula]|uniref:Wall-associated receptor kinase-like protein n=1 Tax=Medicago truncatula TaxID=3880 RepID=A0A072VDZ8_MEDTR|nr:wall-associated receptor kinase-like protein [Medicago truncatula]